MEGQSGSGRTALEKSVSLIKNYNFSITCIDSYVLAIKPEDVRLEFEQKLDSHSKAISRYFREEQSATNGGGTFLDMSTYNEGGKSEFIVELEKEFAETLCSILPEPFIEMSGKLNASPAVTEPVTFDKRLRLKDLLSAPRRLVLMDGWETSNKEYSDNFGVLHRFPPRSKLTCDINVALGWREPIEKLQICTYSFMQKLFEDDTTKDWTIIAGNGAEIKCHGIILAAHSPAFHAMMTNGMKESESKRIEMSENSEDGVRHLLQYFYGQELIMNAISSDVALELFQTGHKYELCELETSLLEMFLRKDVEWFTPGVILELYLFVKNLEAVEMGKLRDHSLQLMSSMNTQELRACEEVRNLSPAEFADLSFKLIDVLQKQKQTPGPSRRAVQYGKKGVKRVRFDLL